MRKLKRLAACVLAGTMAFSIVGCGGSGTEQTQNSEGEQSNGGDSKASNEKTELRIWTKASGPDEGILKLIEAFNESQDEIHASYEYYGENYSSVVQMAISGDSFPDILECSGGITVQTLAKQGNLFLSMSV